MRIDQKTCLEKTYAGFLGMNIGIRLGAPVEPSIWTYERIKRFYGDIHEYVKPFINFAADDDVNGPVYFLRSLEDNGVKEPLTPQMVGEAWLNYAREGVGMFWWGGYGVSTEHTAYLNLLHGVPAPESGSIKENGKTLAEQIGGQIFVDTWGFVSPGDPVQAARLAKTAASVSHDGEGLQGAIFISSAIANAYVMDNVEDIINASLSLLDPNSLYHKVFTSVMKFHQEHPDSWRDCMEYLIKEWGYDRYPGVCHIIPNAGVCAMAMLYGREFSKAIEIATMAGWDTDCNAGNVGSILGAMGGIDAIPEKYRTPVNDSVVLSGISGYLNILDIPTYAKKLCSFAWRLKGEEVPESFRCQDGAIHYDFALKGSTHCMRLSDPSLCRLQNNGDGTLGILFDRMVRGQGCKVFYKNFYRRKDFSDERYMPVFSPTAYSGQTVTFSLRMEQFSGETIVIQPYVHNSTTGVDVKIGGLVLKDGDWHEFSFVIPDLNGAFSDEIGFVLEGNSPAKNKDFGLLSLKDFSITGDMAYTIDFSKQKMEFASVTGFSHNHGAWSLDGKTMQVMCLERADAMTGNYYGKDETIKGTIRIEHGTSALLALRVQGARRGYYAGLHQGNLVIAKVDKGEFSILHSIPYTTAEGEEHLLDFSVQGTNLSCTIDEKTKIEAIDCTLGYGMVGCSCFLGGRVAFGNLDITQKL